MLFNRYFFAVIHYLAQEYSVPPDLSPEMMDFISKKFESKECIGNTAGEFYQNFFKSQKWAIKK